MKISYDEKNNSFSCDDSEKIKGEYIPLIPIDNSFPYEEFYMNIYYNPLVGENSIHSIIYKDTTIGYLFPVEAIESQEHDQIHDDYFLKYAYVALCLLLNRYIENCEDECDLSEVVLSNCFTDYQILITDSQDLKKYPDFDIDDFNVFFLSKGYTRDTKSINIPRLDSLPKNLTIKTVSKELTDIKYFSKFLYNILPSTNDSDVVVFHKLYQMVELLINKVFDIEFQEFLSSLKEPEDIDLVDKKEQLSGLLSEKERIRKLFNKHVSIDNTKKDEFNLKCCELLKSIDPKKIHKDMYLNFYAIRCCIVHTLYKIEKEHIEILKEINEIFFELLINIILGFKIS